MSTTKSKTKPAASKNSVASVSSVVKKNRASTPDPEAAAINAAHRNCELAALQSVGWALITGVRLKAKKDKLVHGQWKPWLEEHCLFSYATAHRYIALADALLEPGSGKAKVAPVQLLTAPLRKLLYTENPEKIAPEKLDSLAVAVLSKHKLSAATLTDLYEAFGIVKKSDPFGGQRHQGGNSTKKKAADPAAEAQLLLFAPLRTLRETRAAQPEHFVSWLKYLPTDHAADEDETQRNQTATLLDLRDELTQWREKVDAEIQRRESQPKS